MSICNIGILSAVFVTNVFQNFSKSHVEILLKLRIYFQKMNSNIKVTINKCKIYLSCASSPAVEKASGHGLQFIRTLYCQHKKLQERTFHKKMTKKWKQKSNF